MDLLKLKREKIEKVGYWNELSGINVTDPTAFYETNTTNITLIVMTREVFHGCFCAQLAVFFNGKIFNLHFRNGRMSWLKRIQI